MKIIPSDSSLHSYKYFFLLFLVITAVCLSAFTYGDSFLKTVQSKFDNSSKYESQEKVYLHLDKPYYCSGENIWFKSYLVNANTLQPNQVSKIVYVELVNSNNEIIYSRKIKIENGSGYGDFKLPLNLEPGQYLIRAYTNFMRNYDQGYFFRKKINISSINKKVVSEKELSATNSTNNASNNTLFLTKPDIQFFPEGGNLVSSVSNRVGFKALDINGKGMDIQGTIVDDNGNKITQFKSSKFGLGRLAFKPKLDVKYKAIINHNGQELYYDLPESLPQGMVMQIDQRKDNYQIKLQSSENNSLNNLVLLGQQNGEIVCKADVVAPSNKATINVPKSLLKQGIIQFALLDKNVNPLCERLVFLENDQQQPKIDISFSKQQYKKRELVEMEISLDDVDADVSVSVTDASVVEPDRYGLDIRSHLLLNSELKGEIENPDYYFLSNDSQRKSVLDMLMMTQGWRRFIYNQDSNDSLLKYKLETGFSIKGKVLNNTNSKKIIDTEMTLLFKNKEKLFIHTVKTNNQGHFLFGDYDINDTTTITLQAKNTKAKKNSKQKSKFLPDNSSIELDTFNPPNTNFKQHLKIVNNYNNPNNQDDIKRVKSVQHQDYIKRVKNVQHQDSVYNFEGDFVRLNEVVLAPVKVISKQEQEARQEEIRKMGKRKDFALYKEPNYTVDFHKLIPYGNVLDMLKGRYPDMKRKGLPLILLDGIPLMSNSDDHLERNTNNRLPGIPFNTDIDDIDVNNIDFVDILKGAKTTIYGRKAIGGIIAIYTKDGSERQVKSPNKAKNAKLSFTHFGYDKAREFYEPIYKTEKPEHKRTDQRSTLCWKPNINLKENRKGKISFYAADISTTYRVELQGITSDGIPIVSQAFINVN